MTLIDELINAADMGSEPFSPALTKTAWQAKKNAAIRQKSIRSIDNPSSVIQRTWKTVLYRKHELLKTKAFSLQFPDEIVPYHIIPFWVLAFGIHLYDSFFGNCFHLSKHGSD